MLSVWRMRTRGGELYEVQTTFWREDYPVDQQEPRSEWSKSRMMTMHSMYDRLRVNEEVEEAGLMSW